MVINTSEAKRAQAAWLKSPSGMVALGFGSGLSPIAPGTAGSLAALPLAYGLKLLPLWAYGLVLLAAIALGVYVCQVAGRRIGVHDHGAIVWDEFCGLWLALMLVPNRWWWLMLGFFIFRFFDIVKPWPAGWFDRKMPNGWGVMLDDVAAGVWSLVVLWLIGRGLTLAGMML